MSDVNNNSRADWDNFRNYDQSGESGSISKEEFAAYAEEQGFELTSDEIETIFDEADGGSTEEPEAMESDSSKDGVLSKEEFDSAVKAMKELEASAEDVFEVFTEAEADGGETDAEVGVLSKKESDESVKGLKEKEKDSSGQDDTPAAEADDKPAEKAESEPDYIDDILAKAKADDKKEESTETGSSKDSGDGVLSKEEFDVAALAAKEKEASKKKETPAESDDKKPMKAESDDKKPMKAETSEPSGSDMARTETQKLVMQQNKEMAMPGSMKGEGASDDAIFKSAGMVSVAGGKASQDGKVGAWEFKQFAMQNFGATAEEAADLYEKHNTDGEKGLGADEFKGALAELRTDSQDKLFDKVSQGDGVVSEADFLKFVKEEHGIEDEKVAKSIYAMGIAKDGELTKAELSYLNDVAKEKSSPTDTDSVSAASTTTATSTTTTTSTTPTVKPSSEDESTFAELAARVEVGEAVDMNAIYDGDTSTGTSLNHLSGAEILDSI